MKYAVWGIGNNGKNIVAALGRDKIEVIIESNENKIGTIYDGLNVVSFETYLREYPNCKIVISPMMYRSIVECVEREGIDEYYILNMERVDSLVYILLRKKKFLEKLHIGEKYNIEIIGKSLFGEILKEKLCNSIGEKKIRILLDSVKNESNQIDYEDINNIIYEKWKYKNQKFKGIHKGKRAFIIGLGPSLTIDDLNTLKENKEICFGVNAIFSAFDKTDWRPDYYVVSDGDSIREYYNESNSVDFSGITKFVGNNCVDFWENKLDEMDNMLFGYRLIQGNDINNIMFSENILQGVYSGLTVIYVCMQLAYYMGFDEIYLLGCDFNFTEDMESPENHFGGLVYKNYVFDYDFIRQAYKKAKEVFETYGKKIYNATRGGSLEVYERIAFDDLF